MPPLTRKPALGLAGIFQSTFRWPLRLAPPWEEGSASGAQIQNPPRPPGKALLSPRLPWQPSTPPNPARARGWQPGLEAVWAAGLNGDEVKVRGLRSCNCPSWEPEVGQGPACQLETPSQSVMALGTYAPCSAARAAPIPARGCVDAEAGWSQELSCAFPPTLPRSGSSPPVAPSVKDRNFEGAKSLGSWPGLLAGTALRPAGSGGAKPSSAGSLLRKAGKRGGGVHRPRSYRLPAPARSLHRQRPSCSGYLQQVDFSPFS